MPETTPITEPRGRTLDTVQRRLDALRAEVAHFGPRSVPSALRRDHVLTAATLAFLTDGFEQTSMQQIADAASVSKPVVYSLFAAKDELFAAVIDRESDEMAVRIGLALVEDGESTLRAGIRGYLRYEQERGEIWGPVLGSVQHRPVATAALRLRDNQVGLIAGALQRGYDELGIAPDQREVEALAHLVMGACDAVANWWSAHPELSLDAVADFLEAALAPALQAIRGDRAAASSFRTDPSRPPTA